tara:strand:+ start:15 stop:860 length:846 start_codon:yes stop_codon:yes gene_type:complete
LERNQHGPPLLFVKMKKSFGFYYYLFIFFIIFLLIEGIYSAYYYKISAIIKFIQFESKSSINPKIWNENGLVETIQNIILFFSVIFIFRFIYIFKSNSKNNFFLIFLYFYFFGLIYYFFEEISWGQHFFFWDSPDFFIKTNNQNETNFHNISNLFNELPRTLLLIWCSFSFLIFKFIKQSKKIIFFKNFILPNNNLKKISFLLLFFTIPDLIVDKFDLHPGYPIDWITEIRLYEIIDFVTFNFIRLSELQELIIDYYILSHAYYLLKADQLSYKPKSLQIR